MDWKIRNIRLQELRDIYLEKLEKVTYQLYESHLRNDIIKQEELDEEIKSYYQHTQPSLQEFYSHYAAQWEHFYESRELTDTAFLHFLENSAYPLQMKYNRGDLNIQYYISRFHTLKKRSKEWKNLRNLFFGKWHHLLANNEYNYQTERIDGLCENFYQLQKSIANQLPQRGSIRLMWLLRGHKELAKQLFHYDEIAKTHPAIRELAEILGKQHQGKEKKFRMIAGIHQEQIITHAAQSDIRGICEGNDLNSLLPIEYCYLSDPVLQSLFFERFSKKKLQMIDYESKEQHRIKDVKVQGKDIAEEQSGPFIICVDTSGSMSGEREEFVKSAILAIAELTEQQDRKCYLISFSDDIACIEIERLSQNIQELADFLCQSFHGGTDLTPALLHAIHILRTKSYRNADLVMMSDFEMSPLNDELSEEIKKIKQHNTYIYALSVQKQCEKTYLDICDRFWFI
ncbi:MULTISPECIES: VWA domain-containing protein [unclassified Bacteroides]|uniref:VWA domain-containing protein n=1 Tax=unclassified Bacteroides TaxID=2646097 RepID=UPI0013EA1648|nr:MULTISPECIES: VWA domain-containing protein [unclassified Bacteroides]QTO24703.1 VWA domain-containing protein [Bacteroides sp. ZJ-18]